MRVSGRVTNNDDETWTSDQRARLHRRRPDHHQQPTWPSRAPGGVEESVGDRITVAGHLRRRSPSSRPGASAPYIDPRPASTARRRRARRLLVRRARARPDTTPAATCVADGRARTFLPLRRRASDSGPSTPRWCCRSATRSCTTPTAASPTESWTQTLCAGRPARVAARLRRRGRRPSDHLAGRPRRSRRGAPARGRQPAASLGRRRPDDGPRARATSESPSRRPPPRRATAGRRPSRAEPRGRGRLADVAGPGWRGSARRSTGKQMLALPWGDVDVAAAAKRDPTAYAEARERSGRRPDAGRFRPRPRCPRRPASSTTPALALADPPTTVLVTDRMFGAKRPAWRRTPGARLILYLRRVPPAAGPAPTTRSPRSPCGSGS